MTENGLDFEAVHYLDKPLSAAELQQLLSLAGLKPHEAIRKNEPAYRDHVAGKDWTDKQLIELMVRYPDLIQRPIVVRGKKAVLARPVERLHDLGIK